MSRCFWLLLLLLPSVASAKVRFDKQDLQVPGQILWTDWADLDADGWTDLTVSYHRGAGPESQRFIAVFFRNATGYSPRPDLMIVPPSNAALYDLGDALPAPGVEILYFTTFGVYAQSVAGRKTTPPVSILRSRTAVGEAEEEDFVRWDFLRALPGRGEVLLVPARSAVELYRQENGAWKRFSKVQVPRYSYYDAESVTYKAGRRGGGGARPFSLRITQIIPTITLLDQTGDGAPDLIANYEDRVAVYPMRADGTISSTAAYQRWLRVLSREEITARDTEITIDVLDIDSDGIADLSASKIGGGVTTLKSETRIYLGKKGGGFSDEPSQVFRDSGFGTIVGYKDIDGDGKNEMVHPLVEVSILSMSQVLLSSKMTLDLRLRRLGGGKVFQEKPVQEMETVFGFDFSSAGALRGISPIYGHDFDGDKRPDVILSQGAEELMFYRGVKDNSAFFDDDEFLTLNAPVTRETHAVPQRGGVDLVLAYVDQPKRAGMITVFVPQK